MIKFSYHGNDTSAHPNTVVFFIPRGDLPPHKSKAPESQLTHTGHGVMIPTVVE